MTKWQELDERTPLPGTPILQTSDKTEYVYEVTDSGYSTEQWEAWTILNKTKKYLYVVAYYERCRLPRQKLEQQGHLYHRTAGKWFYLKPRDDKPLIYAGVWLTKPEQREEEQRLSALKMLGA
jgi:hypothetical protein